MTPGQVVISKRGHDKAQAFVVLRVEGNYAYLADGDSRPITKPKKKKDIHIQPTNTVVDLSSVGGRGLQDADIRKWLKAFGSISDKEGTRIV